jgi:hypothetical protein
VGEIAVNTNVLQISPLVRAGARAWSPDLTFEPALVVSDSLRRTVNLLLDPASMLSETQDRATKRSTAAIAAPVIHRVRQFAAPVVHNGDILAAPASPLVMQEAVRLAVHLAELGLSLTRDADEVVMPSVHQAASGAVQFEWHRKGIDLEVQILPSGKIVALVENGEHDPREVDLDDGIALVESELQAVLSR